MSRPSTKCPLVSCCLAGLTLASVLVCGCGQSALPPPVTVTCRESLVGVGMVIQITNNSSHHLYNVRVVGRDLEAGSSASVRASKHLRPGATVEVGWLEFEDSIPMPGETVEVYCDDYATPRLTVVPGVEP